MDFAQQISIVLVVFALLGVLLWLLRSRGMAVLSLAPRSQAPRRLKSVERLMLTPQHSLHLVQVDNRLIVIGLSPAGCQLLLPGDAGPGERIG